MLGTYLVKLSAKHLSTDDNRTVNTLLHTIGDFERVSDHAVNIIKTAEEIRDKDIKFSEEALDDLPCWRPPCRTSSTAPSMPSRRATYAAGKIEPLEQVVDGWCAQVKTRHIARLQAGVCTIEYGFVLDDLLTNYERVCDHCSNIAVALIEVAPDSSTPTPTSTTSSRPPAARTPPALGGHAPGPAGTRHSGRDAAR